MILEISAELFALFAGFGFLIGILFGFFGMGGSFLVTPALLMMGYPARVAVGSGMAFVFGTAVIATLKHRDLGQVDYKLGALMIVGTTLGIEAGRIGVIYLEALGLASGIINATYILLLGGIGAFVVREARATDTDTTSSNVHDHDDTQPLTDHEVPDFAKTVQKIRIPPMMTLRGDITVSLWVIGLVAFVTGLLSGFLGVGGGFIRMPAMMYAIGVPVPVAVGTDLFEIVFSGGIGSYIYAQSGGVDINIVAPLLLGSALGARLGSAATSIVDTEEIKIYFGGMLVSGSIAVAVGEIGSYSALPVLETVSLVLLIGSAVVVSGAVAYTTLRELRQTSDIQTTTGTPD